jgi:diguanylate cyclase (GGDEF)-like protein
LRISLGERLSGWVGAHRQTIVNSDPVLDLGEEATAAVPRLRSCLSTPVVTQDTLIGVLTLYSPDHDAFDENHKRAMDVVSSQICLALKGSPERDAEMPGLDSLTGLPNRKQLVQFVDIIKSDRQASARVGLLFIEILHLKHIGLKYGDTVMNEAVNHVVGLVRECLRATDLLFRYDSNEFIALLSDANANVLNSISTRISENMRSRPLILPSGGTVAVHVSVTTSGAPVDWEVLVTAPPNRLRLVR